MIYTWSKFNYGHVVTIDNQSIPFDEGDGELVALIEVGSYSLGEYVLAIEDALNAAGDLEYTCSLDRSANLITIAASDVFALLTESSAVTTTAFEMMGFSFGAADLAGEEEYTGNRQSGSVYKPQFQLQSYVPPENFQESVDATINQSADGRVEIVRFGIQGKTEFNLKFITSLPMDGITIRNNPNGLQAARDFLNYITKKQKFEFVPAELVPNEYYKVILESMPDYRNGTGFKLKELYSEVANDVYETGIMQLRVIE